jgi:hypothetical protein
MDCRKLLAENMNVLQTVALVLAVLLLMKMAFADKTKAEEKMAGKYPSPAAGLGTSNVMGFYQGFDQLWGSGSSSYSAPDRAYADILRKDSGKDMQQTDMF